MSDVKRYHDEHAPHAPSYRENPLPAHDLFAQPHDFGLVDASNDGPRRRITEAWLNRYRTIAGSPADIAAASAAADAGKRFKEFVHGWLDGEGVPADPFPDETARHGCRISGRLRWYRDARPAGPIVLLIEAVRRYLKRRDEGAEPMERLRLGDEMRDLLKLVDAAARK